MSYSARMQKNQLYSVLLAPRGRLRMADMGAQIAQLYLSPFDKIIGVIGEAGSGKSALIKGMFPGLELTNDDEGVNVRPLPIMDLEDEGFFKPHTYHLDVRFELGFYQLHELADAIRNAMQNGKRVIVEHFDLIYDSLGRNADLLIGVGEEIIVTRPSYFGPEPEDISQIVYESIIYRKMAHTTEDLCEYCLAKHNIHRYTHGDVRHGFILAFNEKPDLDIPQLEQEINALIDAHLDVSFLDDNHVQIGDITHYCTAPRMHVDNTSKISKFRLHPQLLQDTLTGQYMLVGIVGFDLNMELVDMNSI
ncbi:MAG: alanine-tRNA synthetase second additional domain-containing protein [Eubacteriales bacterium]|nr:alanine-tRNA synthetase second additional domain-containing protein [Clostridiales bacterium]MDY5836274.1 alanine-tRNA synthetase second additional domain-containing protein [Eubacteriales bacterium]